MTQVIFFKTDAAGCGYYRADLPAQLLKESGLTVDVRWMNPRWRMDLDTKVVCFQRHYPCHDASILLKKLKYGNIKILYDLDDDFFNLTPDLSLFRIQRNILKEMRSIASFADVMTVTTEHLKILSKKIFSGNIKIIPNMLDFTLWGSNQLHNDGRIRIGWAGSPSHYKDVIQLLPALKSILKRYDEVDLVFFGYCPDEFKEEFKERLIFHKGTSYLRYAEILPTLGLDIGLIPVCDTEFNRSKSVVKFLEYAAIGLPCVASNFEPYTRIIQDSINGYLAEDLDAWTFKLEKLITDPSERLRLSCSGRETAETYSIEQLGHLWKNVIHNLVML